MRFLFDKIYKKSYHTDNVIRIFGGDDALSEDFITWLQTYAVQIDS